MYLSSRLSRIKFNTQEYEWSKCMDTCPKYSRSVVPSFTDKEELGELLQWISDTTTDPDSGTLYPDSFTPAIWVPYRLVMVQ